MTFAVATINRYLDSVSDDRKPRIERIGDIPVKNPMRALLDGVL
jgi:hypothetical protein